MTKPFEALRAEMTTRQKAQAAEKYELLRLREEKALLVEALEIIAGKRQCADNLMGNREIARAALAKVGADHD